MSIGSVNNDLNQIAEGIHNDVALSSLDFFPSVYAALFTGKNRFYAL
jgi:hypothetical protein